MAETDSTFEERMTLKAWLEAGNRPDAREAVEMVAQVVQAVGRLHEEGRIHRRIGLETVSIGPGTALRLEPLRLTVDPAASNGDVPWPPAIETLSGLALPTDIEAVRNLLAGEGVLYEPCRIDFYQAGALLCRLVSGRPVSEYLRSCRAKADIPCGLHPVLDRALGLDTHRSLDSWRELADALSAFLSGSDGSSQTLPFETLGPYRLVEVLGRGGMGDVYKGYDDSLERWVAIKVMGPELSRDKAFADRFSAEAAAIARLDHPNIVRVYYAGRDRDVSFFAMQYVEGRSLADLLVRRGRLSADEAVPIVRQCLEGLAAAHDKGIIHRDIKPGNILLERETGRALVADFGVAKSTRGATKMTLTGAVLGTADYIAPEQARGARVDGRADLYAMGVLMYRMVSGKLPFEAKSATSMMFQHAYEPPENLSRVALDTPSGFCRVVMRLLAKNPEDRFAGAREAIEALDHFDEAADGAELPGDLSGVIEDDVPSLPPARRGWMRRLLALAGIHAREAVESLQGTAFQVDRMLDEYRRRRTYLADLIREASEAAADLEQQVQSNRRAAGTALCRSRLAETGTARCEALQQKQQRERDAAELAQLAAEQQEHIDRLKQQAQTLDARLVSLQSQRARLRARMDSARAQLAVEGRPRRRRHVRLKLAAMAVVLVLAVLALMKFFGTQSRPEVSVRVAGVVTTPILSREIGVRDPSLTMDRALERFKVPMRRDGYMLRGDAAGIDLWFSGGRHLTEVHLNPGFVGKLDTGISLRSSRADVFETYGYPTHKIEVANLHRQNRDRILFTRGTVSRIYYQEGLIFWFDGDRINQIVLFEGRLSGR